MRASGAAVGIALRVGLALLLRAVRRAGDGDPRFAAKGIGTRGALVVPVVNLVVPILWLRDRRAPYPFWMDDLLLSIVALDLAGNVFDLYDRHAHFDLIPHAHGTGALTVLAAWLLGPPARTGVLVATAGHVLLEAQEIASDRLFGYRNVRGAWDSIGDLAAGAVGALVYAGVYERWVRPAGLAPPSPFAGRD